MIYPGIRTAKEEETPFPASYSPSHFQCAGQFGILFLILFVLILSGGCMQIAALEERNNSVLSLPTSVPPTPPPLTPVPSTTLSPPSLSGGIFPGIHYRSPQAVYPVIIPESGEGIDRIMVSHHFPLGSDRTVDLEVVVNMSIYRGAYAAPKNITVLGSIPRETLLRDYYLSFIGDPAQEEFFSSILGEFREYREKWNLTDDEYLELMVTYVQSLSYQSHPGGSKFPVETMVDGGGDCDDKTLLLAGLLAREGYNVALLYFEKEHHTALGVASTAYLFTGEYSYIETTYPSYVGIVPASIDGGRPLVSLPLSIRVGNGEKVYTRGEETQRIDRVRDDAEVAIKNALSLAAINHSELYQRAVSGDLEKQYAGMYGYDSGYEKFSNQVRAYAYLMSHSYDRKGTTSWLDNQVV